MASFSRSIALIAILLASCSGPESAGNKSEWSVLQGIEYDHRNGQLSSPMVPVISGYRVVGLPKSNGPGVVWVILNPKNKPLYKQLPQDSYHLSASQLAALNVTEPTVLAELRAHVRE
jgi:hypothetical protein